MTESSHRASVRIVSTLSALVALLAFVVLVGGWLLDVERLRSLTAVWSPMAPLTAVLILLVSIGSAQFNRTRAVSNAALAVAFALGLLVLVAYFTNAQSGLVRLSGVFHRGIATPLPELPAPDAAAAFMLLAVALFCFRTRNERAHDFADVVAATIGVICLQVLIAYVYQLAFSDDHTGYRQIAPHSTLAVIILAVTVVAQRPSAGMFAAMIGEQPSALLLRRLLPITVLSCVLVGFLEVEAIRAKVGGTIPDIVAWSLTFAIVVLALLLFVTSASMRRTEKTVQQREQELLQATAFAENASNTKTRFMAVMSHELRTPLTAILGYADMLDAGVAGSLTPEARKFVDRIRSSGWHLVGLIDAVLLYASGRPAGEQVRNEEVDIGTLISEVIETFDAQARNKGITVDIRQPVAVAVWTDRARLREVLSNLVSNSVKFTERGAVTIHVRAVDKTVVIDIDDTGIGIDQTYLARIWEPFEQVDDPHTREHGGMGLGMALTRLLCDQMKVPLSVQSEVGKGTTFTLVLPRAHADESAEPVRLAGRRLLVVDDELNVRRIMKRALERYGAQIEEAEDAAAALSCIAQGIPFDVVVTDISMPGMNGIELAKSIRANFPGIPVIFVTGAELGNDDRAKIDSLRGALLIKPFDMAELARAVANA